MLGSEMRIEAAGKDAVVDSPLFNINATDRTVLVVRMAMQSATSTAQVLWRVAPSPPALYGAGQGDWSVDSASTGVRVSSFRVYGDGAARTYYVPLVDPAGPTAAAAAVGPLTQVRLRLWPESVSGGGSAAVDFVRLSERPLISGVTGCGRVWHDVSLSTEGAALPGAVPYDAHSNPAPGWRPWVRRDGTATDQRFASLADAVRLRDSGSDNQSLPFAATYSCLRSGGDVVVVHGSGFGPSGARVTVGGAACTHVRHDPSAPEERLACRVPAMAGPAELALVAVSQGRTPGLVDAKPLLSYAVGPRAPRDVDVSNVGARHMAVSWRPRGLWDALATTGYVIEGRRLLRPAELWAAFYPSLLAAGRAAGGAAGNDSVVSSPAGDADVQAAAAPEGRAWYTALSQPLANVLLTAAASGQSAAPAAGSGPPTLSQVQAVSAASGVPAAVLAAVEADEWGQVGWRELPALPGRSGSLLSELGGWPALEAVAAAWSPWRRLATTANVSATTVAGLLPDCPVQVRVAAMAEDTVLDRTAWQRANAHGHRAALPQGSAGPWSAAASARTLEADILFDWFDANGTLSYGGEDRRSTRGGVGQQGGEGRWGFVLAGSAHVAGCNATHSCCDGFAEPLESEPSDGNANAFDVSDADGDGAVDRTSSWCRGWWRHALLPEEDAALSRAGDVPKLYPRHSGAVNPHDLTRARRAIAQAGGVLPPEPAAPANTNRSALPWSACRLACAAAARLRPPYVNAAALRSSSQLPLPTPLPAAVVFPGSRGGPPPSPVGSAAAGSSDLPGSVPRVPGTLPSGVTIVPPRYLARPPAGPCGPALRVTGSHPGQSGAAWYGRRMFVREGFSTDFVFQLANPSYHCQRMDDAHTNCRYRGADGLAFVVQDRHPAAMGRGGGGQGWAGLDRTVAVSFDSWHNPEHSDPYENHVAVHARPPPDAPVSPGSGHGVGASESHAFALGSATEGVPDLADRPVSVRVVYEPFASGAEGSASGMGGGAAADASGAGPQQLAWLTGNRYPSGGRGWWSGAEAGTLRVEMPPGREVLRVRVDLHSALGEPADGRAWVGFTAATGDLSFQTHEVLAWSFDQSFAYAAAAGSGAVPGPAGRFPAVVTGGEGEHGA